MTRPTDLQRLPLHFSFMRIPYSPLELFAFFFCGLLAFFFGAANSLVMSRT